MDTNDEQEALPKSFNGRINAILTSPWWKFINSALVLTIIGIGISTCQKAKDAKFAADSVNKQIVDLKTEVSNSIQQIVDLKTEVRNSIKNDIKIVNQSVTRVEKEIANIKEAVHNIYEMVENETFKTEDENVRIKLLKFSDNFYTILIRLYRIPEVNSIRIINQQGLIIPLSAMLLTRNIVGIRTNKITKLFDTERSYFQVSYIPDFSADEPLLSLNDITVEKIDEKRFNVLMRH